MNTARENLVSGLSSEDSDFQEFLAVEKEIQALKKEEKALQGKKFRAFRRAGVVCLVLQRKQESVV